MDLRPVWATLRLANAAEVRAAQHLRYKTYVEEKGWASKVEADHEQRILAESLDTHPASRIYCLGAEGAVEGAIRLTRWAPGEMPADRRAIYSLDQLPEAEHLSLVEVSNFMVAPSLRKTLAPVALMVWAFSRISREEPFDAALIFCTPGLLSRYLDIGLRPYGGRPIAHLTGALIPLIGLSADVMHSVRQGSIMAVPQALFRLAQPAVRPEVRALSDRLAGDTSLETSPKALRKRLDAVVDAHPDSWLGTRSPRVRAALCDAGLMLRIPEDTVLIEPDVAQQEVFVVLEGVCEAFLEGQWVRPMGAGSLFGELALLRPDGKRTASVRAGRGGAQVLLLPRRFLDRLSASDPQAAFDFTFAMASLLAERLGSPARAAGVASKGWARPELAELPVYRRPATPHPEPLLLDANEHPDPLPEAVARAVQDAVDEAVVANRYPDAAHTRLREVGAAYVAASAGLDRVGPDALSFAPGSDALIRALLLGTCAGRRGRVLVADPTFPMVGVVARALGAGVARIGRLPDGGLDPAAFDAAIADPDAAPVRMVYVAHPNTPTGRSLLPREVDHLRRLPEDVLVVVDEAYFELSGHTLVADALSRSNWVVLRTLSKGFGLAAWRVGYAVGGPAVVGLLERLRLPFNLSSAHQAAATAVMSHHEAVLAGVSQVRAQRVRLFDWLSDHPAAVPVPSDASFVFARVSRPGVCAAALAAEGVMVSRHADGLRITVGSEADTDRLLDVLGRVLSKEAAHR